MQFIGKDKERWDSLQETIKHLKKQKIKEKNNMNKTPELIKCMLFMGLGMMMVSIGALMLLFAVIV